MSPIADYLTNAKTLLHEHASAYGLPFHPKRDAAKIKTLAREIEANERAKNQELQAEFNALITKNGWQLTDVMRASYTEMGWQ